MKSMPCLLLGLLAAACAHAPAATPEASQSLAPDFFSLVPGTTWSYEVQLLGATEAVEVKMLKQNAEGFFEDSTGAAFQADAYGVRDHKRYLLRNPITVGTAWTNVVSVSSVEHYQILSTRQPCATRGGSWNDCVVVESRNRVREGQELVNEYTLAPAVGIVSLATVLEGEGKRIPQSKLELVKFVKP